MDSTVGSDDKALLRHCSNGWRCWQSCNSMTLLLLRCYSHSKGQMLCFRTTAGREEYSRGSAPQHQQQQQKVRSSVLLLVVVSAKSVSSQLQQFAGCAVSSRDCDEQQHQQCDLLLLPGYRKRPP
jgi:hypothetical protein